MTSTTSRHASPQAWRRLRKSMTDGELRDIARDIAAVTDGDALAIFQALAVEPWDRKRQR